MAQTRNTASIMTNFQLSPLDQENAPASPLLDSDHLDNHALLLGQDWLIDRMKKLYLYNKGVCHGVALMAEKAILHATTNNFMRLLVKIRSIELAEFSTKAKSNPDITLLLNEINEFQRNQHLPKMLPDIVEISHFTGMYSIDDLTDYFRTIRETFALNHAVTYPVVIKIKNYNHVMTVGYIPETQAWILVDANRLPLKMTYHDDKLAQLVISGFIPVSQFTPLSTNLSVRTLNKSAFLEHITAIHNLPTWQKIHKITPKKALLIDSNKASWLYLAADTGDTEKFSLLLNSGADFNIVPDQWELSPLQIACQNGHTDIVEILLDHKADYTRENKNGFNCFYIAVQNNHYKTVLAFLSRGIDPDQTSYHGTTLLHEAVKVNSDIVEVLLKYGANANAVYNNKVGYVETPLCYAVWRGDIKAVHTLLSYHADPTLKSSAGTPLEIAMKNNNDQIIKILQNAILQNDLGDKASGNCLAKSNRN